MSENRICPFQYKDVSEAGERKRKGRSFFRSPLPIKQKLNFEAQNELSFT